MLVGQVVGTATSTVKHPSLAGWRLLVVQSYLTDGTTADGDPVLAVDSLGAGRGSTVVLTSDGAAARELLGCDRTPVRWTVVGIRDL